MNKYLRVAEQAFVISSLMFYSGGIIILILSGGAGQSDTDLVYDTSLNRFIAAIIYVVTFLSIAARWKKTVFSLFYALKQNIIIFPLFFLPPLSILWSYAPSSTLNISITFLGSSAFGLYLASRYTLREQLRLLGWVFGISIILCPIFAILLPKYGMMGNAWRGIYLHKNGLGGSMTLSTLIFLFLALSEKNKRWIMWCCCGFSLLLLILAQSTSALVNLVFSIAISIIFRILRWQYKLMIPSFFLLTLMGSSFLIWLALYANTILEPLGKDTTLTGRTEIWAAAFDMIAKNPWLGYGYGGFWNGLNGESAYIWRTTNWTPTHPHNGFIALWLDLGLLGLVVFFISYLKTLFKAIACARYNLEIEGIWPLIFLVYMILISTTESSLLESNSLIWIFYTSISLSLAAPLKQQAGTGVMNNG